MSKKTISQMEAVLMDKIQKAHVKLQSLKHKHQMEIGKLAYKHGLEQFDIKYLDLAFARIAKELNREDI